MSRFTPAPGIHNLQGSCNGQTAKAIKFSFMHEGKSYNLWFPLSQVKGVHTSPDPCEPDELSISAWIWSKKLEEIQNLAPAPAPAPSPQDDYEYDDEPPF